MEDIVEAFTEDFLEAVKDLETFSAHDTELREALAGVRQRVDSKHYDNAPRFWSDLRDSLAVVEQRRDEGPGKGKAQQVQKRIKPLEVRFWAKESVSMLRERDVESRLECMVDWVQTFEAVDGDASSDPNVLFQVLMDLSLQKDMDAPQRETLMTSIRDSMHKFPADKQAMLERVGSMHGGGMVKAPQTFDFRRRQGPATPAPGTEGLGLGFFEREAARKVEEKKKAEEEKEAADKRAAEEAKAAQALIEKWQAQQAQPENPVCQECGQESSESNGRVDENDGLFYCNACCQSWELETKVDPALLERTQRAVLALLESNSGEVDKKHVRNLLNQAGLKGMPLAALGEDVFCSGNEVFLRRESTEPAPALPQKAPLPEGLRQQMVELVREGGGRLALSVLVERLTWHGKSTRQSMHGPLRRCLAQVPELWFEPDAVLLLPAARRRLAVFGVDEPVEVEAEVEEPAAAAPYVSDAFAELVASVRAWLVEADGVLDREVVLPFVKELGFKPGAVIRALSRDVFWTHPQADCEILLRTPAGAAQHPNPIDPEEMHEQVVQKLYGYVREMGPKARSDNLAGKLNWNARSELAKAYGPLRTVLARLPGAFFDPRRLYLKRALDGVVEWPVSHLGRIGPAGHAPEEAPVEHWTPEVDDTKNLKVVGDPEWLGMKRQILGMIMSHGGKCEAELLRRVLQPLEGVTLESIFDPESTRQLCGLLFWSHDRVYRRRLDDAEARDTGGGNASAELRRAAVAAVRARGSLSLAELKAMLQGGEQAVELEDEELVTALRADHEFFCSPELVYLRHVALRIVDVDAAPLPQADEADVQAEEKEEAVLDAEQKAEQEADRSEDAAEAVDEDDAMMALALAAGDVEAPADDTAAESTEAGPKFFSFNEFAPEQEAGPLIQKKAVKRRRLNSDDGSTAPAWSTEALLWATAGCAVTVHEGRAGETGMLGVILSVVGGSCSVRLRLGDDQRGGAAGAGLVVEREFPTAALRPVEPKVGNTVKVVAGARSGCTGTLVGLAGADGVVQIGTMSYETLPMKHMAVVASVG